MIYVLVLLKCVALIVSRSLLDNPLRSKFCIEHIESYKHELQSNLRFLIEGSGLSN